MVKAKSIYLVMSRDISVDRDDGMNSIFKIIDNFSINVDRGHKDSQIFGVPMPYCISSRWSLDANLNENKMVKLRTQTIDPSGKLLGEMIQEHTVPKGHSSVTFNMKVDVLPVTSSGKYLIKTILSLDNQTESFDAVYPYDVTVTQQ